MNRIPIEQLEDMPPQQLGEVIVSELYNSPINIDYIRILINLGAETKVKDDDEYESYLIHSAVCVNNLDLIKLLINSGVDLEVRDNDGRTPLHLTAIFKYVEIAKLLIESGANLDACDDDGKTTLYEACRFGSHEIIRLLLAAGASKDVRNDYYNNTPWDIVSDATRLLIPQLNPDYNA